MNKFQKPRHEVADVLVRHGDDYLKNHRLPMNQLKVINAIRTCRTSMQGGHLLKCRSCSFEKNSYNSCRNRHCPKCQGVTQLSWIDDRSKDLLPVKYFHLVFTIPSELNHLCLTNQKVLYDILFKASSQTVKTLSRDEKLLGAEPSILSVLHTWGQQLMDHPHIHMIVSAGGKTTTNKWRPSKKKFFLPVRMLSKVFRAKFLCYLKEAYQKGIIKSVGKSKGLKLEKNFQKLIDYLFGKPWVVYTKKPFKNAGGVLRYLGKYTHKVAISNHRIESISNQQVSFTYKDYKANGKNKVLTLDANEFIRRFLLHVLPKGFFKIRHYGIIASRNKKKNLAIMRLALAVPQYKIQQKESWQEKLKRLTGFCVTQCPKCKKETLLRVMELPPLLSH